jgi:Clp amino terminal domain, pathogenicity island component
VVLRERLVCMPQVYRRVMTVIYSYKERSKSMDDAAYNTRWDAWRGLVARGPLEVNGDFVRDEAALRCEALLRLYLDADPKQRRLLVARFQEAEGQACFDPYNRFDMVGQYTWVIADEIKAPGDTEALRRGLAVIDLVQGRQDPRDMLMTMGRLHYAATQVGLDPTPFFQELAANTSSEMRQFLETFLGREDVRAKQAIRIYRTPPTRALPQTYSLYPDPLAFYKAARGEAERLHHNFLGTGHLLLALLHDGQIAALLQELGVPSETVREAVEAQIGANTDPEDLHDIGDVRRMTIRVTKFENRIQTNFLVPGMSYHLLLAMLEDEQNFAGKVLRGLGLESERVRKVAWARYQKLREEHGELHRDYGDDDIGDS